MNHQWSLTQAASEVTSTINGQVNVNLPIFFPTPDQPLDPTTPAIKYSVTDITNPAATTTEVLPNFSAALSGLSLNTVMNQLVDGWDGVTRMLQAAMTRQINATNIPVVGSQLQQALGFLQQLDSSVTNCIKNARQIAALTVQDAIFDTLGPSGLNWLVNLVPGGGNTEDNFVQFGSV